MNKNKKTTSQRVAITICCAVGVLYALKLNQTDRTAVDLIVISAFGLGLTYNTLWVLRSFLLKKQ